MKKTYEKRPSLARREFLRTLGATSVVAAASVPFAGSVEADTETSDEKRKARYSESEHVKAFYRVNRYPT